MDVKWSKLYASLFLIQYHLMKQLCGCKKSINSWKMNWKGFKDKVCDPNEYHPFPFHLGRFMVFINIILLEIIFNNFRLANVISGQVHLFFFFMKMQMLGIVSAYNKRLADMGRGGGGGGGENELGCSQGVWKSLVLF